MAFLCGDAEGIANTGMANIQLNIELHTARWLTITEDEYNLHTLLYAARSIPAISPRAHDAPLLHHIALRTSWRRSQLTRFSQQPLTVLAICFYNQPAIAEYIRIKY